MISFDGINGALRPETLRPAGSLQGGDSQAQSERARADGEFPPVSDAQRIAAAGRKDDLAPRRLPRPSAVSDLDEAREEAESRLNALLDEIRDERFTDSELRVRLDEETDRFVYQRIDRETGEVTQQIPPEDMLRLIARLREVAGIVFDRNA